MTEFSVEKDMYSREVLLKTAYGFTDKVYIHLSQNEKNWLVSWQPKEDEDIPPEVFENELIAQSLRELLIEKTTDIRKLILARAFASTIIEDEKEGQELNSEEESKLMIDENIQESENEILKDWFSSHD